MGLFGILMMMMVTSDIKVHIFIGRWLKMTLLYVFYMGRRTAFKVFVMYPSINK